MELILNYNGKQSILKYWSFELDPSDQLREISHFLEFVTLKYLNDSTELVNFDMFFFGDVLVAVNVSRDVTLYFV